MTGQGGTYGNGIIYKMTPAGADHGSLQLGTATQDGTGLPQVPSRE